VSREQDELEVDADWLPFRVTMDFGYRSSNETGNGGLLNNGDPHIREIVPQTRTLAMGKAARIAIKEKGRILFIDPADVIAVEARGNYVLLSHTWSSHMLRESISTMEEKLNLHGFVRIHRSVLVNAALVEEIRPCSTGEYVLRMQGGREFTVTRTYKKNLQLLAQLWIGTESFAAE
jgi:DNA-binding LytR/AlgR family response regulator